MTGWRVEWNGTALSGDECPGDACLLEAPDGMGVPGIRNEDVTYMGADGIRMHRDWYENRVLTFQVAVGQLGGACATDCDTPNSVRQRVHDLLAAWSRQCDEGELVIWGPCDTRECGFECDSDAEASPAFGPYGVIGRPRAATVEWQRGPRYWALITLRFDAVDHRLYLLNGCGDPGSGEDCVDLLPTQRDNTVMCWDEAGQICWVDGEACFEEPEDLPPEEGPQTVENTGTECACAVITLTGPLQEPSIVTDDGQQIDVHTTLLEGDVMVIDCCTDRVTLNGTPSRYLVEGCIQFDPGSTEVELFAFTGGGSATVCHRDNVVSG